MYKRKADEGESKQLGHPKQGKPFSRATLFLYTKIIQELHSYTAVNVISSLIFSGSIFNTSQEVFSLIFSLFLGEEQGEPNC